MSLSRVTPSGWRQETGSLSRVTPTGWRQEVQSSGITIVCTVGNAVAAGALADIAVGSDVVINCVIGNAVAVGLTATITVGSDVTINCTIGNAVAVGLTAAISVSGSYTFTTEPLINNTHTIRVSEVIDWTWYPAGVVGAMSGITAQDGSGTTAVDGTLTITSTVSGAGFVLGTAGDGSVYYEEGSAV